LKVTLQDENPYKLLTICGKRLLPTGLERLFRRLKNWRHIATWYDRYATSIWPGAALAATVAGWIK